MLFLIDVWIIIVNNEENSDNYVKGGVNYVSI